MFVDTLIAHATNEGRETALDTITRLWDLLNTLEDWGGEVGVLRAALLEGKDKVQWGKFPR